jgi:hypothetical protein
VSTRNNTCTNPYTLTHLKANNWWIKKENAPYFIKKLGLEKSYDAYYQDVYVWLPDICWGKVCMPCCPSCRSNEHVGNKGFHDKHFGRLIIGLKENYYVIGRRMAILLTNSSTVEVEIELCVRIMTSILECQSSYKEVRSVVYPGDHLLVCRIEY